MPLLALLATACAGPDEGEGRPLEVVIPSEISTLDPRYSTRSLDVKVTRLVHAGLIGLTPDTLEPVPLAAESFRFVTPRILELTLKDGVRFHSGKALEPADVCATIEAVKDESLGSPHRPVVAAIGARRAAIAASRSSSPRLGRRSSRIWSSPFYAPTRRGRRPGRKPPSTASVPTGSHAPCRAR
jgi:peptide/nickel transport system substrate-binding protein